MPPISLGSCWRYVQNQPGKGELHVVLDLDDKEDLITTVGWTGRGEPGHSWRGEPGEFYLSFVKA